MEKPYVILGGEKIKKIKTDLCDLNIKEPSSPGGKWYTEGLNITLQDAVQKCASTECDTKIQSVQDAQNEEERCMYVFHFVL